MVSPENKNDGASGRSEAGFIISYFESNYIDANEKNVVNMTDG